MQNPSHTYSSVGSYTVALTATNAVRQQHQHEEQLHHRRQHAGRELLRDADHRRADAERDLHRQLHEQPDRVVVDFRRFQLPRRCRTRATPTAAVGSYTVALTATNAYGNNTNTKNNYITVGNKPVANFSGTPTERQCAAGGDLHRLLHEQPDRVVLDLWRLELRDGRRTRAIPTRARAPTPSH